MMKRPVQTILITLFVVSAPSASYAQTTWHVDDDCAPPGAGTKVDPFCTIQQGINAASDGDTVLVEPGTYSGEGNRDISLFGKTIVLKSAEGPSLTVMDIEGSPSSIHRGFFLIHGESNETLIEGFTIKNGYLIGDTGGTGPGGGGGGGAFYIRDSSPTIRNCIIRDHISATLSPPFPVDGRGAGIYVDGNSSAVIENCIIAHNHADRRGGGIMLVGDDENSATIRNCVIGRNTSGVNYPGGGIKLSGGTPKIVGCVIVDNEGGGPGGGIHNEQSEPFLSNCVLWGNQAGFGGSQIHIQSLVLTIEYSDVQGGLEGVNQGNGSVDWGPGMIQADPLFVDPENGDFRISAGSPCIDAGNNLAVPEGVESDLDGGPRFLDDPSTPDTGNPDPAAPELPIVDMGPYEFDPDDCNNNDVPDEQDIADGTSSDVDGNGIPDECQSDCNNNDIPDSYEINEGMSEDCDVNGVPDECEPDCNENGQVDACDIADGVSHDCDGDGILDECEAGPPIIQQPADAEVQEGDLAFFAVQVDGVLLEYQWRKDGADLVDSERIFGAQSAGVLIFDVQSTDAGEYDCVITDLIDLDCITSDAATLTVLLLCPADFDDNGTVGAFDLAFLLGAWGPNPNHPADLNNDGAVGAFDLAILLGAWGTCTPP